MEISIDMWKITWSISPSSEDHCLSSILADLKQLVLLGDNTGAVPRASLVRDHATQHNNPRPEQPPLFLSNKIKILNVYVNNMIIWS